MLLTDLGQEIGSLILARVRDVLYWLKELFT
jgi:hypothetical protein